MGRERTNNAAWLRLTALVALIAGCYGRGYYGVKIGDLSQLAHAVKGEVFAVDSRTIHIRGFSYDGTAPDAFFYAGTSGQPSDRGYIIPDEKGTKNVLGAYRNKHITITLPDGQTLKDIAWISVWCRAFTINFGHVMIPIGFDYPRPQKIDAFPTFEHGVSSDRIVVVDAQTFLIPNFSYDGQAPDAHFWVGKGAGPGPTGNMVPDENGAELPLKKYTSKTIVITLPADQTVFDIDHLSVWCQAFFADFGHVRIPKNLNIPPSLKMLGVAPQSPGYSYSAPSSRPSFSHKPKSASYKPTTPKSTTYRPPTTTRRYKAKAPRPTYKPTTTRRPYKPRTTTPRPYRPPTTTPRPYRPPTTTRKPYRPPTTTRKPYRPPTTTPRPYRPPTTTPRYKAPKPTYRPTTPRTPYKPTTPRDIYNPFAYRPPQTTYRPTTTPRPYYRPSTTPYYSPPSSSYRPVYRHPSATNRDPHGHFGHFGTNKAIEFPRESEEHSSSSSKSSKRHKTASTYVTKEVAPARSSSEEESRYRSEEETRSNHPRKSQSSSSSSKSRSRSHSSSPGLSHFQAASHFTAASHFGAPNHRFSHSKGRSDEDLSGSSERSLRFPYHQRSSESYERDPDSDRRYTRSHGGEKRSNEDQISKSYSSVSINMKGGSMSHFIHH